MKKYDHKKIESKWQRYWGEHPELAVADDKSAKPKQYILDMFPYPSGDGLHTGHVESYTATDIISRYLRMKGFNVLHPQGFDAFGLPAENFAIKTKIHPAETTKKSIETFKRQMNMMGLSYDWSREVVSSEPEYYKWTQWFFLLLYKNGLAYKKKGKVNWCASCQTVLANEQAEGGVCDRCGKEVMQKDLDQWYFSITKFIEPSEVFLPAEASAKAGTKEGMTIKTSGLLDGLDKIDWPESTKAGQRNWIGRSEGAQFKMKIITSPTASPNASQGGQPSPSKGEEESGVGEFLEVYTTRLDTVFGMTFALIAPEHKKIQELKPLIKNWAEVEKYIVETKKKTDLQRISDVKEKTGVELEGVKVVNPFTKEAIPLFASDFVLAHYGTGAVMAVPAHDERDFAFAKKFNLPIKPTVFKQEKESRSFVMGLDEGALKNIGVSILGKTKENFFKIKIPYEKLEEYKELVRKNMQSGFWNEFSTSKGFYFIFKHKDGRIEEMELNEATNDLIDKYGATFNDKEIPERPRNVYSWSDWIDEDAFYHELLIHTEDGVLINSGEFNGLTSAQARTKMTAWLEKEKIGKKTINYRLRDWLVSRQRYWGAPIPIIYCDKCGEVPVPEKDLPVQLPTDVDFMPTGESPLAKSKKFQNVRCPKCGGSARRESDTMDTFVCSSWYYLRYADNKNDQEFASKEMLKKWLPVDLYVGGAEHVVLHLLYARFFTKVLHKLDYIDFDEPFLKLRHQGMILAPDGRKMSKSWGNVINPNDVVAEYGADALRMFEMFMGPLEDMKPWNTKGIVGIARFLERAWNLYKKAELIDCSEGCKDVPEGMPQMLHKTIKKVTEDIEGLRFNTAISQLMVFVNFVMQFGKMPRGAAEAFLILLAPFAPHMAEELWSSFAKASEDKSEEKYSESIFKQSWPKYDEVMVKDEIIQMPVQINGKVRSLLTVSADISEADARKFVMSDVMILKWLGGKEPKKIIFVKGKLVNIVV
jgi:leucyl-tRNA synthetase